MSYPQSGFFSHSRLVNMNIVMESKVIVKHVFQEDRASRVLQDADVAPVPDQSAQPELSLVCCSCLKIRPSLLVGECACLVCSNCWARQDRSLHCTHCDKVVKYIKLETLLKFPAMGKMGELFLTEEAFGNLRVAELTSSIKKQQKMQDYVSKILDKQDAAWKKKIRLEKVELKKTKISMRSLSQKISSKLESIAALEESIKNLSVNDSSQQQEWAGPDHFATSVENLQGFGSTRQRGQVPPPSRECEQGQMGQVPRTLKEQTQVARRHKEQVKMALRSSGHGKVQMPSRQSGQSKALSRQMGRVPVPSNQSGQVQMPSRQSGQVVLPSRLPGQVQMPSRQSGQVVLPSRLSGQVLAVERPTGQMAQVQVPSSRTGKISSSSCQELTPDTQHRQALPSSSQMDKLLPKNDLVPQKLTGKIEQGQTHQIAAYTQPRQANYLPVLNGHSRKELLGKLSLLQVSSANTKPPPGQYKELLPTHRLSVVPPQGSRLVTKHDQPVHKIDEPKPSLVPVSSNLSYTQSHDSPTTKRLLAFSKQETVGQYIPAVSQQKTTSHSFQAVIQQVTTGHSNPAVTHQMVDQTKPAVTQQKMLGQTKPAVTHQNMVDQTKQAVTHQNMVDQTKQAVTHQKMVCQTKPAIAQQKMVGQTKPAVPPQKMVGQTNLDVNQQKMLSQNNPAGTQQRKLGQNNRAGTQQKTSGHIIPAVTQQKTAGNSAVAVTQQEAIGHYIPNVTLQKAYSLSQRQVLPANTGPPTLSNLETAAKESVEWPSRQLIPAVRSGHLGVATSTPQLSRREGQGILENPRRQVMQGDGREVEEATHTLGSRDGEVRNTEDSLEECRVSDKKEDAKSRETISDKVEEDNGVASIIKRKRKWKLASGVIPDLRKVTPATRRRKVIPVPIYH